MRRFLLSICAALLVPTLRVTATTVAPVTLGTKPPARSMAQGGQTATIPALSPAATRTAETLLREQLPCLGCHTLRDSGGRMAPDLATVRQRRSARYIAAIIDDPARVVPAAAMPRTRMLPATRDLIVRYLQTRPGSARDSSGWALLPLDAVPPATSPVDGAALYSRWCASCHGVRGAGDGVNAPSLPVKPAAHADASLMANRPDDSLYDTIAGGGAIMNKSARMPAFGGSLSPAEIRALVAHIRTLCRCSGPAWSRDGLRSH